MCDRFFVLSIDSVMPRIIFQDDSAAVCDVYAERHWSEVADEDELVLVTCKHDRQVVRAQRTASC